MIGIGRKVRWAALAAGFHPAARAVPAAPRRLTGPLGRTLTEQGISLCRRSYNVNPLDLWRSRLTSCRMPTLNAERWTSSNFKRHCAAMTRTFNRSARWP
jgi:hypothetical protein